ncbi:hypothetical protein [Pseudomonas sp. RL_5y_Pfl2_73]|uniref:hypothetical protein n=1 Tax=Pseudomonas sp. RL_5y_Pfl2_73 TaxID=3088713 RepID=UPI0030DC1D32
MDAESIYDELVKLIVTIDDLRAVNVTAAQQLKQSVMPKSIYKYRLGRYNECGSCWDIENLKSNQIRMTLPEAFNDPYDSSFNIAIRANNETKRQLLDQMIYTPSKRSMRIPRHLDTQPTIIWTLIPRSLGQAVGAQRRRFALLV